MYVARFFRLACFLFLLVFTAGVFAQSFSCTVQQAPTDPASTAFAQQNYVKAFELYSDEARKDATNFAAVAGQIRSLLKQQKVAAASDLAEKSTAANPKVAALATVLAEVRFRQGRLADATAIYPLP